MPLWRGAHSQVKSVKGRWPRTILDVQMNTSTNTSTNATAATATTRRYSNDPNYTYKFTTSQLQLELQLQPDYTRLFDARHVTVHSL